MEREEELRSLQDTLEAQREEIEALQAELDAARRAAAKGVKGTKGPEEEGGDDDDGDDDGKETEDVDLDELFER